jgi:AraC family transcriptional regulator
MSQIDYFTATKSHCLLPLGVRPTILQRAIGVHGVGKRVERYRIDLWSLHLYRYPATLMLGETAWSVLPGMVGITPPGVLMNYLLYGRSEHDYVHFSLPEVPGEERLPTLQVAPDGLMDRLRAWPAGQLAAEVRLWDILWSLTEPTAGSEGMAFPAPVQQTIARIEVGLSGTLCVKNLAEESGFSHGYLTRLFREATGQTIASYIVIRRLERARHLLRHSSLSVKEIAETVGIPDLGTFHKTFSRAERLGPRAWRERQRVQSES